MKRLITMVTLLSLAVAGYARVEKRTSISKDVSVAAPHLPALVKQQGNGAQLHVDNYSYSTQNEVTIKSWIQSHPAEAKKFMSMVTPYLEQTDVSTLSATELQKYNELKAQWVLVRQWQFLAESNNTESSK